jgi:formamidopyrimidine-DNA glycosylase
MDQQIVAGIGNIYSDEILVQARIDPAARTDKLAPRQLKRLFAQMRKVLKTAVSRGAGSEQFVDRMPRDRFSRNARRQDIVRAADR